MELKRMMAVFLLILFVVGMTVCFAEDSSVTMESSGLVISMMKQDDDLESRKKMTAFSLAELEQMELIEQAFSLIDQNEGAIAAYGLGVPVEQLLVRSEIPKEKVRSILFLSGTGSRMEISAAELLETERYCYYDLPELYDRKKGSVKKKDFYIRQEASPLIVWRDQWLTTAEYTTVEIYEKWEDPNGMTDENAYRLLFGQHDITEQQADRTMSDIHEIVAVMEDSSSQSDQVRSVGSVLKETFGSPSGNKDSGSAETLETNEFNADPGESGGGENAPLQEINPVQEMNGSVTVGEEETKPADTSTARTSRRLWIAVLIAAGVVLAGSLLPIVIKNYHIEGEKDDEK